jgi:hypothetical protein
MAPQMWMPLVSPPDTPGAPRVPASRCRPHTAQAQVCKQGAICPPSKSCPGCHHTSQPYLFLSLPCIPFPTPARQPAAALLPGSLWPLGPPSTHPQEPTGSLHAEPSWGSTHHLPFTSACTSPPGMPPLGPSPCQVYTLVTAGHPGPFRFF